MTRETAGERDPRDANGKYGRESCEALRRMAQLWGARGTGQEEERKGGGCGERERTEAAATPVENDGAVTKR